jgi:hypothetical protein
MGFPLGSPITFFSREFKEVKEFKELREEPVCALLKLPKLPNLPNVRAGLRPPITLVVSLALGT